MQSYNSNNLRNFSITQNDYSTWVKELIENGYSKLQADQLILRKNSNLAVRAVLEFTSMLSQYFSREQIIIMASCYGGCSIISSVVKHIEKVIKFGFTIGQIAKIVSRRGGGNILRTIVQMKDVMIFLNLLPDDIVKIVCFKNGSKNLTALSDAKEIFSDLNFDSEYIVKLAGRINGYECISEFLKCHVKMLELGLDPKKIINIVLKGLKKSKNKTTSNSLSAAKLCEPMLEAKRPSKNILIPHSSETIEPSYIFVGCNQDPIYRLNPVLSTYKINNAISSHIADKLDNLNITSEDYVNWKAELLKLGYTEDQINILIVRASPENFIYFLLENSFLLLLKFSHEQIIRMILSSNDNKNIQAAMSGDASTFFHFNQEEIVLLVSHYLGFKNIQAIIQSQDILLDLGFDKEQLVKMAGHRHGFEKVDAIVKFYSAIKLYKIPLNEIVLVLIQDNDWQVELVKLIEMYYSNHFRSVDFYEESSTSDLAYSSRNHSLNWTTKKALRYWMSHLLFNGSSEKDKSQDILLQEKPTFIQR